MHSMKTSSTIMWIVVAVILIGLFGWAVVRVINSPAPLETGDATSTSSSASSSESSLETYANPTYGFAISYPSELRTEPFTVFHALKNSWRVNSPSDIRGTSIVSIPVFRIDNSTSTKKAYPLFFDTEVRVGVSGNTADCYARDEGYTMQTVIDTDINGVTWKKFIFGDAAMMQYLSGASYRTIHDDRCYVIEQIRTGSVYRDDSMTESYTDRDLDDFYARTTPIVMSFRFTD